MNIRKQRAGASSHNRSARVSPLHNIFDKNKDIQANENNNDNMSNYKI